MIIVLAILVLKRRLWTFFAAFAVQLVDFNMCLLLQNDWLCLKDPVRLHLLVAASALVLQPLLASCSRVDQSALTSSKVDGSESVKSDQSPECLAGSRPYFGDTHLHTSASPDAGMFGNTLDRDVAYEFAQGKKVTSSIGEEVQLRRPHDFIVVADHAESIGLQQAIERSDEGLISDDFGKRLHDLVKDGKGVEAASEFIRGVALGTSKKLPKEFSASEWGANLDSAEANNKPGVFTALVGFEWTSQPGGGNLHRVVIFRDGKDRAEQITCSRLTTRRTLRICGPSWMPMRTRPEDVPSPFRITATCPAERCSFRVTRRPISRLMLITHAAGRSGSPSLKSLRSKATAKPIPAVAQ